MSRRFSPMQCVTYVQHIAKSSKCDYADDDDDDDDDERMGDGMSPMSEWGTWHVVVRLEGHVTVKAESRSHVVVSV